jgi:nucleotide-binding universal stress UspA family protein
MSEKVRHIVCAVRGSPQSRATVTRAIDLALAHDARLTFAYAVDVEFLAHMMMGGRVRVVYRELVEMSEFTMLILEDRARRRGVTRVDSVIREGDVCKQLTGLVREMQPDLVILGRPVRGTGQPRFKPAELEAFITELELAGARVEVVPGPEEN